MGRPITTALKELGFCVPHMRCEMHITNPGEAGAKTTIVTPGTPVKLAGVFSDGISQGISIDANGKMTVTQDCEDEPLLASGSANGSSNKVAKITFILYKNGVEIANLRSPIDFENANVDDNFAITTGLLASEDDYFEVYVDSDTANTEFTCESFNFTLWGR